MRKTILFLGHFIVFSMFFSVSTKVFAHCDTLERPVIKESKVALEAKDVIPVLKWVSKEHEAEVKTAFDKALKERAKGVEAKEKADMEFFEVLVRIHREGEGAPFAGGIKPVGTPPEPAVLAADEAIEVGTVDSLVEEISSNIAKGIRERSNRVIEAKKHMNESFEAGREYVAAYVEFVHYVEGIHKSVSEAFAHHLKGETAKEEHQYTRKIEYLMSKKVYLKCWDWLMAAL
jgi:hypothetical protein